MELERRSILEKHWKQFRLGTGLSYEPMSDKAYEVFESAMEEYAQINNERPEINLEEIRLNTTREVYNKWHELDNEFEFSQWLYKETELKNPLK